MTIDQRYCPTCNRMTAAEVKAPPYVAHVILSMATCGLWLPVMVIILLFASNNARCRTCGSPCAKTRYA